MRVALAQLNPIVGDVDGNAALVLEAVERAAADGADVLLAPELVLVGYPPRDLLLRAGVVEAAERAVASIAAEAGRIDPGLTVLVGYPRRDERGTRPLRNSAAVCRGGEIVAVADKMLLPGYDVFDEDRYFEPGERPLVVEIAGRRAGVLICEDLWLAEDVAVERRYDRVPLRELAAAGCDVVLALNASPFVAGKWGRHVEQLRTAATRGRVPIVSVNQVGANDDLVFDGRSVVVDPGGAVRAVLPGFRPAVETVDLDAAAAGAGVEVDPVGEVFDALVLGLRDYCVKSGTPKAVLGLSGGIDSAVTAAIAVRALGPGQVTGVYMPSRYSARMSEEDAAALARGLGLDRLHRASIEGPHLSVQTTLARELRRGAGGVTDENIQCRLRGLFLMAFSNAGAGLVLATSNKSEMAAGYCTLYGDMCGAVAVLGDLLKSDVYRLGRWINDHHAACGFDDPPIPPRTFTRPPTAELRPDQTDQDTLPPYDVLDEIVRRYVDEEASADEIAAATGYDPDLVRSWTRRIDAAQYKRDQAAVVLKVAPRSFGRGRVMPIVMKSTGIRSLVAVRIRQCPSARSPRCS